MAKEYFCAYYSYLASMRNLSDAECGRLFRALLQYGAGDKSINLQGRESIAFDFMAAQIDRDNEAYSAKCAKNRANGALANGTERGRTLPNATERYQTPPKEKEKEKENIKERTTDVVPKKRFSVPSVEEVAQYCAERRNGIDAETFVDYYNARGWAFSNKQTMKDWRAAVRTWERNRKDEKTQEVDRYADLI